MTRYILFFLILGTIAACFTIPNQYAGLAPGYWRATLDISPNLPQSLDANVKNIPVNLEEIAETSLPFVFEVIYKNETDFHIEIINGEERIKVEDIQIGLNRATGKDTFLINFPIYESYIKGLFEERIMAGDWVVTTRENYKIPFVARYGKNYRFTQLKKEPIADISGKWEVLFTEKDGSSFPGLGEFKQNGNHLTGTFRTETGDYRYLEGTVQADKVYLSVFDGAHSFLFEAKILDEDAMLGSFKSGKHYQAIWEAKRNPNYELADPNQLTFLKEGYDKIAFAFKNPEGKTISLTNETYQSKAKIVQIFGTWCPNCRDETNFLVDYFNKYPNSDIEIISLAFEKHRDKTKANAAISRYKQQLNIPWEIVVAGYSDKKEAAQALPMLNHILSYPTLIFIDKNDHVQKIHTGFNGPATSKFPTFIEEFEATIAALKE